MAQIRGSDGRWYEALVLTSGDGTIEPPAGSSSTQILSSLESAQREGRAYSVGTGVQTINSGSFLKGTFVNPPGSGKVCYVTNRLFSNNRKANETNLEAQLYVNSITLTTPNTVMPNNLKPGGQSSATTFQWSSNSQDLGASILSRILPLNGTQDSIDVIRIVNPGGTFTYQIRGAGNAVASAARASISIVWFEEDVV